MMTYQSTDPEQRLNIYLQMLLMGIRSRMSTALQKYEACPQPNKGPKQAWSRLLEIVKIPSQLIETQISSNK